MPRPAGCKPAIQQIESLRYAARGFRVRSSPFDGIKEAVIEAIKGYSYVKTSSLPW